MTFFLRFFVLAAYAIGLASGAECTIRGSREEFTARLGRQGSAVYERVAKLDSAAGSRLKAEAVPPGEIPSRTFVDDAISGKLRQINVPSAPLTTDEEFVRRVYLDLTGRPPTPDAVRQFLSSSAENKRSELIDTLVYSREFVDKWTMWLGDLLKNVAFPANFDRQYRARNAFYEWMLLAMANDKSLREIAHETVAATGNSYEYEQAAVNFPMNGIVAMGPIQDRYDNMLVQTASTWLGLSHYDCLLCHSGRGHLDGISLWGVTKTRMEAQRMASFFARINIAKPSVPALDNLYNSYNVTDRISGNYDLNTNFGNRPNREPIGELRFFTPAYRLEDRAPSDGNWRRAFADFLVDDPMFAVNLANRLWKEMFGLPLVDPVDSLDPARLDPSNPPPAPWSLQATHPELLVQLAEELKNRNYSLREFVKFLAESNAYQLSSRYGGTWKVDYVPLFARHYPRRLEGEEVHDAIVVATGVRTMYTVDYLNPTPWAMAVPDPNEPRSNGAAINFMRSFYRGNCDSFFRIQDGSILQQLTLMNDTFVTGKMRVTASPALQAVSRITDDAAAVEELFLLFLNRKPDEREAKVALKFLASAGSQRNAFLEDLAWTLVNKIDFLFSY